MTDASVNPPPAPDRRRIPWLKVVLAVSLALNLAVAGLAAGAWLHKGPDRRGMPRDLSFGPFGEALTAADRRALRQAFQEKSADPRADREAARGEFQALLAALRATPFRAEDLRAALDAIETRLTARIDLGGRLIEERLLALPEAERLAFAERLERVLQRGRGN
jgi:uncharacterized membrane protein